MPVACAGDPVPPFQEETTRHAIERLMNTRIRCPRCLSQTVEGINPFEMLVICLDCGYEMTAQTAMREGLLFDSRISTGEFASAEEQRAAFLAQQQAAGEIVAITAEECAAVRAAAILRMEEQLATAHQGHGFPAETCAAARRLLMRLLSPSQQAEYEESQRFTVVGSEGGRYRIAYGRVGNVTRLSDCGQPVATYCAHPKQRMPTEDILFCQKLSLQANEAEFLAVANLIRRYDTPPNMPPNMPLNTQA